MVDKRSSGRPMGKDSTKVREAYINTARSHFTEYGYSYIRNSRRNAIFNSIRKRLYARSRRKAPIALMILEMFTYIRWLEEEENSTKRSILLTLVKVIFLDLVLMLSMINLLLEVLTGKRFLFMLSLLMAKYNYKKNYLLTI